MFWLTFRSRAHAALAALLSLALVASVDCGSGIRFSFTALYIIAPTVAAWNLGRLGAVVFTALTALVWGLAQIVQGASWPTPAIQVFNIISQSLVFAFVAWAVLSMRALVERERTLGRHDELTRLPNRRSFSEVAEAALVLCRRSGLPASLAYVDVNEFKSINDSFGHAAGDRVLQLIAAVLRGCARQSDLPVRLGGDEFAVFMPDADAEGAARFAERLHNAVAQDEGLRRYRVSISVGLSSTLDGEVADLPMLLHRADASMYEHKAAGSRGVPDRVNSGHRRQKPASNKGEKGTMVMTPRTTTTTPTRV